MGKNILILSRSTILYGTIFSQDAGVLLSDVQSYRSMASTNSSNNRDVITLPPEILDRQTCSECHKYLSVGPVVVTRLGKTICGRCNTNSLYDQVAEKCLFPCVNHNAGCKELLPYNEAKEHEANCDMNNVSCPFCYFDGREDRLVQHFMEEHSEYVVDDTFEVIPAEGYSRNLIFLKDRHILCMTIIIRGKFLKFYNKLLAPSTSRFRHFALSFFKFDDGSHFVTLRLQIMRNSDDFPVDMDGNYEEVGHDNYVQLKNCFLLAKDFLADSLRSDSYCCRMDYVSDKYYGPNFSTIKQHDEYEKMKLSKLSPEVNTFQHLDHVLNMNTASLRRFIKKELREMQTCTICKVYVIVKKDIFFCPNGHLACKACVYCKCPRCESFVIWSNHSEWHNIHLKCEWDCEDEICIFDYLRHVQLCKAREYRCPDRNCRYVGCLKDIKKHWHLPPFLCGTAVITAWAERAFYWLILHLNEFVYVTKEMISNDLLLTVYEDIAVLPESYKYGILGCTSKDGWFPLKKPIGWRVRLENPQGQKEFELSVQEV